MARWVKYFLHEIDNLSLDPQGHLKVDVAVHP